MPGFDGTGPWGMGPGTGWGLGPCGGGYAYRRGFGRGFRRGFGPGFGRGFGWRWWANYSLQDELEFLRSQKEFLEQRINELENELSNQPENE